MDVPRADEPDNMDRGLYIAASGMLAEQVRQDQIANDLANASTPGYKADRTSQRSFGELLLANSVTGATIGSPGTAVRSPACHRLQARSRSDTGEPLDFAISGEGFFAVQTAQGARYTRNGQFPPTRRAASSPPRATPCSAATASRHGRRRRQASTRAGSTS